MFTIGSVSLTSTADRRFFFEHKGGKYEIQLFLLAGVPLCAQADYKARIYRGLEGGAADDGNILRSMKNIEHTYLENLSVLREKSGVPMLPIEGSNMGYEICIKHNGKTYCWNNDENCIDEITVKHISLPDCPEVVMLDLFRLLSGEKDKKAK